jgi:hypothetical protein
MENILKMAVVITLTLVCASGYYCVFGVKLKKNHKKQGILISFAVLVCACLLQYMAELQIWHCIVMAFFWCVLQFEETIQNNIKIFLLEILVLPIIGNIIIYGMEMCLGGGITDFEQELVADVFFCAVLWFKQIFLTKTVIKIREFKTSVYCITLTALLFTAFMVSGCSYVFSMYMDGFIYALLLFVISGSGLMICVMAGLMFYTIHRNYEYNLLLSQQEEFNIFQKHYYLKLLEKEEDTRRFRHDISNHLLVVYTKIKEEKREDACHYIEELQETLHKIRKKNYDVGNDLINAILNYYFDEEESIKVYGYINRPLFIEETDLCILFSNLMKNVSQYADRSKEPSLHIQQGEQSFVLEVCNKAKHIPELNKITGFPETTRADRKNHGFGLENVRRIVEKYDGKMKFNLDGKEVKIKISFTEIDR